MPAYYNEIEPFAAEWLRALIKRKLIPDGEVDERSIVDVSPDDLIGFNQCHFFAGIGGWPYALRLAGWDDEREVFTGSCPCQSLSTAGKGGMHTDDWRKLRAGAENPVVDPRHLWPAFYRLIAARKPAVVFGEQVGKRAGIDWLTAVRADLEDGGYAVGAADLPACGVGAPHIRQRVFWSAVATAPASSGTAAIDGDAGQARGLAHSNGERHDRQRQRGDSSRIAESAVCGGTDGLAISASIGRSTRDAVGSGLRSGGSTEGAPGRSTVNSDLPAIRLGDSRDERLPIRQPAAVIGTGRREEGRTTSESGETPSRLRRASAHNDGWAVVDWIRCRDAKWRPTQYGILPLADGLPKRMGRMRAGSIRGYGNAIVPGVAKVYIEAVMDWIDGADASKL